MPSTKPKAALANETSTASRGAVEAQPDDLHNEPPAYPEDSRTAREQGVVILRVEVTAAGEPSTVNILKSSGYFRLDQAARRAVQHWKFHPALTAGIAVSSEADVPVHFRLE
jgi:protein TonB